MEKEEFYEDKKDRTESIVVNEGLMSKFVRNGLLYAGIAAVASKSKGTDKAKIFDSNIFKVGAMALGTVALSRDDDRGGDLLTASSFLLATSGVKHAKNIINSDFNTYKKAYGVLSKADEVRRQASMISMNLGDKIYERFTSEIGKAVAESGVDNKSIFSTITKGMIIPVGKATYKTLLAPTEAIRKEGFIEGMKTNFFMAGISSDALKLQEKFYREISSKTILNSENIFKPNAIREGNVITDTLANIGNKAASMVLGKEFGKEAFSTADLIGDEKRLMRKINKYNEVINSTSFTDVLGKFTKFNEDTGNIDVRYDRLFESNANFMSALDELASKFRVEKRGEFKNFDDFDADTKSSLFKNFLIKNDMGEIVEKAYKKKELISIGEMNSKIAGKTIDEIYQTDSDLAKMIVANKGLTFIEKVSTSYDEDTVIGIKNADILKDFAFTNVVSKSAKGFSDETALNGTMMSLQALGAVEKTFVGMYKNPLARSMNIWNPFKLIDAENRSKTYTVNNILGLGGSENGIFLNGRFIENVLETKYRDVEGNRLPQEAPRYVNKFFSDGSRAHKMTYSKNTRDVVDQHVIVSKENLKENITYGEMYNTYKTQGFKSMAEQYFNSNANFTPFRYKKGEGFRRVKESESYFQEGSVLNGILEPGDINYRKLRVDNRSVESGAEASLDQFTGNLLAFTHSLKGKDDVAYNKEVGKIKETILNEINFENYKSRELVKVIATESAESNPEFAKEIAKIYNIDPGTFSAKGYTEKDIDKLIGVVDSSFEKNLKGKIYNDDNLEAVRKLYDVKKKQIRASLTDYGHDLLDRFNEDDLTYLRRGITKLDPSVAEGEFFDHLRGGLSLDKFNMLRNFKRADYDSAINMDMEDVEFIKNLDNKLMRQIDKSMSSVTTAKGNKYKYSDVATMRYMDSELINEYRSMNKADVEAFRSVDLKQYDEFFEDLRFYKKVQETKFNVKSTVTGEINKNSAILSNANNIYLKNNGMDNEASLFNDVYESALGFEYSKMTDNITSFSERRKAIAGALYSTYKTDEKVDNVVSKFYGNTFNTDLNRNYGNGHLGQVKTSVFGNKNSLDNFESYKYYEGIRNEHPSANSYAESNFFKFMESYQSEKFNVRGQEMTKASYIVEDTLKKHMEAKTILDNVALFIRGFQSKNKEWFGEEYAKQSKFFGQRETTFGIMAKTIFKNFQDTAETIGFERITNDDLGSNWTDHAKNMFLYRYVPIAAAVTGAIALNSATDAIVPDEMPIFGNGLVGVGTRAYATARVGLQYGLKYTGALAVMKAMNDAVPVFDNGLTSWLDPLMDPSEMIDVYFKGKAVRVNKNRNWFTAGRQSGDGEEFGQYRPHMLYTMGNPTSGIYDNKFEKLFRQDLLVTKYPWYILDPYKEEREAYEKFGAKYPITEQLFKDVPVIGHLLSATIGESIKPTQYVWEDEWRVGNNLMKNPHHDPNNPTSPEYLEFQKPNRLVQSVFEGIEDLQSLSGLPGYVTGIITKTMFGASNPYEDDVVLNGIDLDTNLYASYNKLQLGGLMGITEPIRRLLDSNTALGTIAINPIEQALPQWMPDYFKTGNNPFMRMAGAEYILGGEHTEKTMNYVDGNDDLNVMKTLSMIAPGSKAFSTLSGKMQDELFRMSKEERESYYQSLSYASEYGTREYNSNPGKASEIQNVDIKIKKMISPYEFLGEDGKRYKIDSVESDYNKLSERVGTRKAMRLMDNLTNTFKEGSTYSFNISNDATYSVGIDDAGDFLKVDSGLISRDLRSEESAYNKQFSLLNTLLFPVTKSYRMAMDSPMPSYIEKIIGKKSVLQEWSAETVQAPYFRDWDNPISSFIDPIFNYSANSMVSGFAFNRMLTESFDSSNATLNPLSMINMAGMAMRPVNMALGRVSISNDYSEATTIGDELEKIKMLSGDKSYYNMTGKESLKQFSAMVDEQDSKFLKDLANVTNQADRAQILNTGNERLSGVLKTIWNRHQNLLSSNNSARMYDIEKPTFNSVTNIGAYDGNAEKARIMLKQKHGYGLSKLDNKRLGIISSQRGGISRGEAGYISSRMYQHYNSKPRISSTIYPKGSIDITRTEE